ncbi:NAD(P)/FAD-dependent oxidoreductase [Ruania alba]|uniref:Pyridine nucleotide-disulphide oxidoreductase n=1 Tax=Ruania alba TaxID=648782 RepID=A0A1H5LKH9_9MICO|nr:FAD/NAD(P)-binding oxidoreductase [Ruania alba]SEE77494.1 Pyridine nucleotide-disulphide oxidoreductase [Ruania alba]
MQLTKSGTGTPHIVIVGASLSGLTTAEALRERGEKAPITLIGAEQHLPYNRPALSKQVLLGTWTPEQAAITDRVRLDALDVQFLPGMRAESLDLASRTVSLDGRDVPYSTLIVATGARPRTLPHVPSAHTVRTLDDAAALRAAFDRASRVVIVGAGVLGCEIAAAARSQGLEVTLLGRGDAVRLGAVGNLLEHRVDKLLGEHGVDLRLSREVLGAHEGSDHTTLYLADGQLRADLVVGAIGCEPEVEWLRGSGLALDDGILCDATGRAAPGVFAVGDVARWTDAATGAPIRVEHQLRGIEHARAVAEQIATGTSSPVGHPFYWTELFGTRIQVLGTFPGDVELRPEAGDMNGDRFVAVAYVGDTATGVIGWNMARAFRAARLRLPDPLTHSPAQDVTSIPDLVGSGKGL